MDTMSRSRRTGFILLGVVAVVLVGGLWWIFSSGLLGMPTASDSSKQILSTPPVTGTQPLSEGTIYQVDSAQTSVAWEGRKTLIANYADTGTLAVQSGTFQFWDGVVSGTIVFDMTTIQALSTGKGIGQEMLTRHLQSPDFFDVAQFPTAEFRLKEAVSSTDASTPYLFTAKGDLTVKGITQPVEFPVTLYADENRDLHAEATVSLDRTRWNIRFGSDTFFDNLGDGVIDDLFTVRFSLVAPESGVIN